MDRETYIEQILNDHLSDKTTYNQLDLHVANKKLDDLREQSIHLFQNPLAAIQNTLSATEHKDFEQFLKEQHRTPTFYGLVKIHKNPWSF